MKLILFFERIIAALAAYTISGWGIEGDNSICFSNESPLEGLVHYWEEMIRKRRLDSELKSCKIGEGDLKEMNNRTVMTLIEEVQLSISPLRLTCQKDLMKQGVSIDFNGLDDTEPGKNIVDCNSKKFVEEIGIFAGDGHQWESRFNKSFVEELEKKSSSLRKALGDVENLRVTGIDDKNEIASLIRENQMLQHRISNLSGTAFNVNNSLRALEEELREKDDMHAGLQNQIRIEKDKAHQMHLDMIKLKAGLMTPLLLTTVLPITIAASQKGTVHPVFMNPYPHVRNRIGNGNYKFSADDDATCRPIDYNTNCAGFDHMVRPEKYPFFNSYVMHLTPLEALEEGIIEKEGESCEMGSGKDAKCLDNRRFIRGSCPNGITGVYFIDDKGKLQHSKCKSDDFEITEDCMFCRKIKKKAGASKLSMKTSVSLQDAICQKESTPYNGPKLVIKGVCSIGSYNYKRCANAAQSYENVPFVTFTNQGKMYLDRLMVKNVELISNISFICYEHKGQDGTESDTRELKRVKPDECKNINTSKSKICTGDHIFCEKYGCTGTYPVAKCLAAPGSGPILVNIHGTWTKPRCVGYENVLVRREVKLLDSLREESCETCNYECAEDGVKVTSTGFKITSAVSCSHGSCVSAHQEPSTTIIVPYPGMSAAMGGEIGLHLSHTDDSISLKLKVTCEARDICETHHCFFCTNGIINYQCHTIASGLILSTLISFSLYVVFMLLGKLFYFFRLIPKKLRSPFMWIALLLKWFLRILKSSWQRLSSRLNRNIGWNHEDVEMAAPIRNRRVIPRFNATLFLIFVLVPGVLCCSESLLSNSKQTKCTQSDGKVKCSVTATVTVKAGIIGAETCFIIKGPMDNQQKTVRIKTMSSEVICREGNSFWTSHYTPSCLSSRRCHLVGECQGNRCQSWNDNEVSKEFKGVNDNMLMNENKCFEQCGAAGCGCFNINPSCLFVHTVLRSVRAEAVRVFSCVDWIHRITFLVTGPEGEKEEVILGSLGTKFLSWGTISLSLDAEGVSGSNSFSFLESSRGGFAIYDEAFSEVPREGFLGEIRCSSESAAVAAHSSCIRAPNLIKYKPMTDQIDCTASLIDPFAAFVKGSLPQVRNGMTYTSSKDKKTVQAFNNGAIKALVTINMEDHEIEFLSEVPNCEASFVNITGCYSCNYGARVCVKIKSDGNANFIASEEKGTYHISFNVWRGTRDYCQIMHFDTPNVDSITHYSCGGNEKLLNIRGLLISVGPQDLRNTTGGASVVVNPSESSWSLGKWAGGLFSWLGGSWTAILKIIGFLLLGFLIVVLLLLLVGSVGMSYLKKTKII
ncbi:polyprotein [Turuna virus]|uniref:Envelopment polyprotein n=1 Tax=Turuna virus TaxID=629737 RepID=F2W3T3_9VIRU|nr:polyprotein [Turuna virus]AEA30052.1 polyprotein [Turuna virus]